MTREESVEQLKSLIEAWQLNEADLNQTDINAIKTILKENQELKKQLEEYLIQNINLRADIMIQKMAFPNELIKDKTFYNLYDMPTYEELLAQQKEFIKYLEDESKEIYRDGGLRQNIFRQILQKYKEITGVSDEKK